MMCLVKLVEDGLSKTTSEMTSLCGSFFFLRTFESTRFDFHEHEGHWFAGLGQEVLQKPSAKPSGAADSCRSPRMTLTMDSEVRNLVKHGEAFFLGDW
jgi:hypothetical protein